MDPTIELLNEVWSGARTGLTSLRAILDITDDTNLRNEIYRQETEYQNVVREAENLLAGHGERPDGVNCMERACTWTGIRMSTLTDKSTPHMAGLLIQGNTMGVIELTKARADCEGAQASAQASARPINRLWRTPTTTNAAAMKSIGRMPLCLRPPIRNRQGTA